MPTTDWLKIRRRALYALGVIGIWQSLGLNMVLFLAGLKSVPRDLYDAAAVDGADGAWEQFRRVTWPMLGPACVRAHDHGDPFVPGLRHGRGADRRRTEQVDQVLLYKMYTEGFTTSALGLWRRDHRGVSRLRSRADAAPGQILDGGLHYA